MRRSSGSLDRWEEEEEEEEEGGREGGGPFVVWFSVGGMGCLFDAEWTRLERLLRGSIGAGCPLKMSFARGETNVALQQQRVPRGHPHLQKAEHQGAGGAHDGHVLS